MLISIGSTTIFFKGAKKKFHFSLGIKLILWYYIIIINTWHTLVDKAWIYTVDGQLVKYVNNNPESVNVSDLSSAMYVVKMQKGNVVRSQKMFKK